MEQSWTDIFSPGFIACILAFIIYWFNIKIPADAQSLVNYCGNACTLLSLLVIGMSLVGMNLGSVFKNKRLLLFTAVRFIAVPIALALLLKPFLPDYIMRASVVLMMSLPVANMPMMMAEQYGKETTTISEGSFCRPCSRRPRFPWCFYLCRQATVSLTANAAGKENIIYEME